LGTTTTSTDTTIDLQSIDSILNNSGPPNVALKRSLSVPDSQSQLNSVYTPSSNELCNSSQISPLSNNRLPMYSTLSQQQQSFLNYGTTTNQTVSQTLVSPVQYQTSTNLQPQSQNIYISQTQPTAWCQPKLTLHQQNSQLQVTGVNNNPIRQNFINQQQEPQSFRLPRNINMSVSNSQILGNGVTEFTRNELRAFVGVRSQQGNTRLSSQLLPIQNIPADLDPLGINFDMSPTGENESPKWSSLNSDLGSSSSPQPLGMLKNPVDDMMKNISANSTVETDQKSSLLQKLLSE